jgi:predicted RNA-binding Zn-ribbon protein involved in translation (DUF1610 family)
MLRKTRQPSRRLPSLAVHKNRAEKAQLRSRQQPIDDLSKRKQLLNRSVKYRFDATCASQTLLVPVAQTQVTFICSKTGIMIAKLFDALFGCSHTNYSFPVTMRSCAHRSAAASLTGTYIVCLDCGKEFAYDWEEMRILYRTPKDTAAPRGLATLIQSR